MLQDETKPEDTVAALRAAGLDTLAYAWQPGKPWPTLGQLVHDGTPLVVFSQTAGGSPDWFLPQYSLMQDNPYSATSIDDLSCAPNRGPLDAPLLLVNHWISKPTPDVADAARMNERTFLLDRLRRCEEVRGQRVNFVAVDFWHEGGLFDVVDDLNSRAKP
jgi:hypothetical protein